MNLRIIYSLIISIIYLVVLTTALPFNLLGQAQVFDDLDDTKDFPIVENYVYKEKTPDSDKPTLTFFEAPVTLSNPIYNLVKKARFIIRWIRSDDELPSNFENS
ncbi:unnamed protein product [Auanema sp. JU1783]|nr:unnamed protein product [Auanema sp. JU1783]